MNSKYAIISLNPKPNLVGAVADFVQWTKGEGAQKFREASPLDGEAKALLSLVVGEQRADLSNTLSHARPVFEDVVKNLYGLAYALAKGEDSYPANLPRYEDLTGETLQKLHSFLEARLDSRLSEPPTFLKGKDTAIIEILIEVCRLIKT